MVSEHDKGIFFPRSFNEQMAWIDAEVDLILRCEKRAEKGSLHAEAKINRNEGHGHVIDRLFKVIKEDPKNIAVLREVEAAERELWAFLEHEHGAKSEEEICAYWHNYSLAYMAELESSPTYYFLMRGYDEFHDADEWIGIYSSLTQVREAYRNAVQALEQEHKRCRETFTNEHEKVMIHTFNETAGWRYDISPEVLLSEKSAC